jgi:fatty acid desaturase
MAQAATAAPANGAPAAYPPLKEVRRTMRVRWYRSPIDPTVLRGLMQRSDLKGWFQSVGPLLLLAASGLLTWHLFARQVWLGFAAALFLHGTMGSIYAAANHELTHGTVFRTKALNQGFKRFYALLTWFNFYDYAMSHTYHHRYTLHPNGDREEVLPRSPTFRFFFLVQILTLNFTGGPHTAGLIPVIGYTVKRALNRAGTGNRNGLASPKEEWLAAVYAGHPDELRKSVRWARLILLCHALLLAVSITFQLWLLPVLVSLPIFIANFWRYVTHLPMHCGLRTNVADFRKCVRSIKLDPLSTFLYWRMNWHMEHHMYAGVPCYNLRRLGKVIAADTPEPKSLFAAWREMRATWRRQQVEPDYQYDVPLPDTAQQPEKETNGHGNADRLGASIGDLAPAVIAD